MTTPTPVAPLVSKLARRWRVDVDTSTTSTPSWIQVRGIRSLKAPINPTLKDDGDYDSGAWGSQTKTALAWELQMTLKQGTVSGVDEPAQAFLRKAGTSFGTAGVVHVRWYDRAGGTTEAYEGYAEVSWDPSGGARDDIDEASCTLTGKGARTDITNPASTA